jgi:hypothetical protein
LPRSACWAAFGFLNVAEVGWAHAIRVPILLAAIALGVAAAAPRQLEDGAGGYAMLPSRAGAGLAPS